MTAFGPAQNTFWVSNNFGTYLLLQNGYDPARLEAKFPDLMRKYASAQLQQFTGQTYDEFTQSGNRLDYSLQPITSIHLHSNLEFEVEPNGNIAYVYLFAAIASFILMIACINFMNLATARSAGRAKEVGLRKVMGSNRRQLIRQFLSESVLMSTLALVIAVVLVLLLLKPFNDLAGKDIGFGFLANGFVLLALLGLPLVVGLLAGSYPAFFLSSFQPVTVLKGKFQTGAAGVWLRKGLVVFQFAISIALIVGTFVVFNQLRYVREKALGFDKEHVVVIPRAQELAQQTTSFKEALREEPGIARVASATTLPGGIFAVLAILIACLGLFGLAAFTTEQRTKEIGVRKVLGASVPGLVLLLSREFTRLVLVALLVATPLAYFGMHRWLEDFAYRTEISWPIFLMAGSLALAIALLTVSYHAFRAATVDPVKSLRYE